MPNFSPDKKYALFGNTSNKKTIAELTNAGCEPVIFPLIETKPFNSPKNKEILANIAAFDWLIFTDVYTVEYFVETTEEMGIEIFELDDLRVCAYGESVADRLRFSQVHSDVIPPTIKTKDVLQQIKDYVSDESELPLLNFLILHEESHKPAIVTELSGSQLTAIANYSFEIAKTDEVPKLKALLKGGAIDEFIFSSHYDVLNFAQMFQTENLSDLLRGINLNAVGDAARKSLQEFRLI